MADTSLIQEKRSNDGSVAGIDGKARLFLPQGMGLVLTDANGAMWELTIGTDGVPVITTITI